LHREAFTHRKLSHREAFTQRSFYTEQAFSQSKLLHREAFTQSKLYTQQAKASFYTGKLLHREDFTQSGVSILKLPPPACPGTTCNLVILFPHIPYKPSNKDQQGSTLIGK